MNGSNYNTSWWARTEELQIAAKKYVGKEVTTTHNRVGTVTRAFVRDGVIQLVVVTKSGNEFFTDNEHATISRNTDPGTDSVPVEGNRGELEE